MSIDSLMEEAALHAQINGRGFFAGKFPYGSCSEPGCEKPAAHDIPAANDNGLRRVCRAHKPEDVLFVPYLGQQTKTFETDCRYVLAGGGAGGGKSYVGARLYLKQWQVEQERFERGEIKKSKAKCLFLRRTMPEVQEVIDDFKSYVGEIDPNHRWVEQKATCYFSNGLIQRFGGMEDEDSWRAYWGSYWTLVVMDEAVGFTIRQIEKIDQRIRCDDVVLRDMLQLYLLTNPISMGGQSSAQTRQYLKRRFVKVAEPEEEVKIETTLTDGRKVAAWQVYIPSNVFDNPSYMEDGGYEATIRRHGQLTIRALLFNDWDVDEGAWVGDDWDPSVHIVAPFEIPAGWFKFKMGDYGFAARSVILWGAVDPENNVTIYRSFSCRQKTVEELGYLVREIESQPLIVKWRGRKIRVTGPEWDNVNDCSTVFGPMDAALWSRSEVTGIPRGEILDNIGCGFSRSAKDPDAAAEQIRQRLRRRTPLGDGTTIVPGLRFFATCSSKLPTKDGFEETGPLISIPGCPADKNNPDRWDTGADDHDLDALGYGCLSRPLAGEHDSVSEPAQVVVFERLRVLKQAREGNTLPNWSSYGRR